MQPKVLYANENLTNLPTKNNGQSTALLALSNITINGMVKVDFIQDLAAPSGDRINYTTISTDDSGPKGQSRIHARESRIGAKYRQDINGKELTAIIEGDFYGGGTNSPSGSEKISNSVNFRLRHAYLSYDEWTVGQTWSNYVDVKSFPETLDFSNETGQAFIRQAQVRYQHTLGHFILSYSLENPETDIYILEELFEDGTDFQTIDPLVDFTAKAKYQRSWGHVSVQAVARKMKVYINENGISELGYGVGISGKINITSQDTLKFHYSQGDGIGRYIQEVAGSSGLVIQSPSEQENDNQSLTLLQAKGGYLGYQHRLNKTFRMNINSGFIDINYSSMNDDVLVADRTKSLLSFHGNLIWTILPNLDIGLEHSIAKLKTVSGGHGTIKRLQLSAKYRF
jgi:hypothetical protein